MDTRSSRSYSADVRIQLAVNGSIYSVAQLGPDFVVLRGASEHPPAVGEITMWIDTEERSWAVNLVEGIAASRRKTKTAECLCPSNGIGKSN